MGVSVLLVSFTSSSQTVTEGNFIIDAYYGFPNFGRAFSQSVEDVNTSSVDFRASGLGPAGLRFEYMISERVGIGADIIYNSNIITLTDVDTIPSGMPNARSIVRNENEYIMQRFRSQIRLNYHFDISSPDFDSYIGVGAGTNNRFRKTLEIGVDITENDGLSNFTLFPVSVRIALGARYYFTNNIGLNLEIGLGGPVLSAGLSIKL